jgi:type IV pilus assembly protein PilA
MIFRRYVKTAAPVPTTLLMETDQRDDGFTLIELLVVIIIIGILAAIAIPVFLSQKTKGYEASMKSDLRTVAQDIESQNVDTQDYANVIWGAAAVKMTTASTGTAGTPITIGGAGGDVVNLSQGNTVNVTKVVSSPAQFCLSMTHTGATTWYYNSSGGGVTKTACP